MPFCSAEQNHFRKLDRGSATEYFCKIISKSVYRPRRRYCLKVFQFLGLTAIFLVERNDFSNFGRRSAKSTNLRPNTAPTLFSITDFAILLIFCCALNQNKEHFFEIILKSDHWPRRRRCLKVFPFLALVSVLCS